jgi:peroxiredoxin
MKIKNNLFVLASMALLLSVGFRGAAYGPGDTATDFNLIGTDGNKHSLTAQSNAKGFIVVFTCNHCPFAKLYEDRIIALDKKYKTLGYPVVAINPNDTAQYPEDNMENMKIRAAEKGFTFPYLWDETQTVAKAYGAEKTPHVYILQRSEGKLLVKYVGAIDNNSKDAAAADQKYVENALDQLLAGKEVAVKSTKAIGCSIKWKP